MTNGRAARRAGPLAVYGLLMQDFLAGPAQSDAVRHGFQMTLDDWARVTYPLVESRFRWAALGRVVETPEALRGDLGSQWPSEGPLATKIYESGR